MASEAEHFDVIVVGGGVIGCSVAFYAAGIGARVLVLEKAAFGGGASSANPGSVALSSKQPGRSLDLAIASRILYETLQAELDADLEFAVEGNLTIAETPEELAFVEDLSNGQRLAGVPVRSLSADECRALNPLLEGPIVGGAHCPIDAHTNPFLVTAAFARGAVKRGAQLRPRVEVLGIDQGEAGKLTVRTVNGPITCDHVVNAAGLAAPRIGAMLGLDHDVIPRAGHVAVLEAAGPCARVKTASASQLLAKHGPENPASRAGISLSYNYKPASGTILLGGSNQKGIASREVSLDIMAGIIAGACRLMPRLEDLTILRAWAGVRPYAPGGPILGRAGADERYLAAFGHGGDGMALAPVTGRYVAEQLRSSRELSLEEFLATMPGGGGLAALAVEMNEHAAGDA